MPKKKEKEENVSGRSRATWLFRLVYLKETPSTKRFGPSFYSKVGNGERGDLDRTCENGIPFIFPLGYCRIPVGNCIFLSSSYPRTWRRETCFKYFSLYFSSSPSSYLFPVMSFLLLREFPNILILSRSPYSSPKKLHFQVGGTAKADLIICIRR